MLLKFYIRKAKALRALLPINQKLRWVVCRGTSPWDGSATPLQWEASYGRLHRLSEVSDVTGEDWAHRSAGRCLKGVWAYLGSLKTNLKSCRPE